jgi:hypothetical protein
MFKHIAYQRQGTRILILRGCEWWVFSEVVSPLYRRYGGQNLFPHAWVQKNYIHRGYYVKEHRMINLYSYWSSATQLFSMFTKEEKLPLKNSTLKTLLPWRIPSSKPFTSEEFEAQNPLPLKNSKLWRIPSFEEFQALKNFKLKTLYHWRIPSFEEFQAQNPLPLKNSKLKTRYP